MFQKRVDQNEARSVDAQCQLCCRYKELECSEEYGPDLRFLYRSDTQIIDDIMEPWSNKTVPMLEREGYSSIDSGEDILDNMIENWWNGSFSIPAPCSYNTVEETQIKNEEQSIEGTAHTEEEDYEDLFKRLMNVDIYAVAEYMSNGEPFCFNEHIINSFILCTAITVLYLILEK